MDDFSKLVQRCSGKNLENHTIFNSSTAHAIILIRSLLEVAARDKQPIKIFSGCFDPAVYNSLVESLEQAIAAGVEISLISEFATSPDNQFINIARDAGASITLLGRKTGLPHFVLIGAKSYRIESNDILRSAKGNFNDPVTGSEILALYNNLSGQRQSA